MKVLKWIKDNWILLLLFPVTLILFLFFKTRLATTKPSTVLKKVFRNSKSYEEDYQRRWDQYIYEKNKLRKEEEKEIQKVKEKYRKKWDKLYEDHKERIRYLNELWRG